MQLLFFFNDTAPTEIYPLSLHDALPISVTCSRATASFSGRSAAVRRSAAEVTTASMAVRASVMAAAMRAAPPPLEATAWAMRSEEHTAELQSRQYLVCRLLLEKNIT